MENEIYCIDEKFRWFVVLEKVEDTAGQGIPLIDGKEVSVNEYGNRLDLYNVIQLVMYHMPYRLWFPIFRYRLILKKKNGGDLLSLNRQNLGLPLVFSKLLAKRWGIYTSCSAVSGMNLIIILDENGSKFPLESPSNKEEVNFSRRVLLCVEGTLPVLGKPLQ